MKYAEFESLLGEVERARAIFELAIAQPTLVKQQILWKVIHSVNTCCETLIRYDFL